LPKLKYEENIAQSISPNSASKISELVKEQQSSIKEIIQTHKKQNSIKEDVFNINPYSAVDLSKPHLGMMKNSSAAML